MSKSQSGDSPMTDESSIREVFASHLEPGLVVGVVGCEDGRVLFVLGHRE